MWGINLKIEVYSWRNDNYYFLEGEILKETFDSSWEEEKSFKTQEGNYTGMCGRLPPSSCSSR